MSEHIKCVVWDLDDTLWHGTLAEDGQVVVRQEVVTIIEQLDRRGILHSIASRNSHDHAMNRLREAGLEKFFLYPQINWGSKSESLAEIAKHLNVGLDTFAFVDDQAFERDEVRFNHPMVSCFDALDASALETVASIQPRFITQDSAHRREMYQSDAHRNQLEERFSGPKEEFLASLGLKFKVANATEDDLRRAEELTVRTNQLNTTGLTFSFDELKSFISAPDRLFLVASLDDRYGTYGKIGLALIVLEDEVWRIQLLLMSCRVMARGVGNVLINLIRQKAKDAGVRLEAEFIETNRNRMMYMTYKFNGFSESIKNGDHLLLDGSLEDIQSPPSYIELDAKNIRIPVTR